MFEGEKVVCICVYLSLWHLKYHESISEASRRKQEVKAEFLHIFNQRSLTFILLSTLEFQIVIHLKVSDEEEGKLGKHLLYRKSE